MDIEFRPDENGNSYPIVEIEPRTREESEQIFDDLVKEGLGRIPESWYTDTSRPMDLTIVQIMIMMCERDTEEEEENHKLVFVWDVGELTTISRDLLGACFAYVRENNVAPLQLLISTIAKRRESCDSLESCNIEDIVDDGTPERRLMIRKNNSFKRFYNSISDEIREDGPIVSYELIEKSGLAELATEICNVCAKHQALFFKRWKCSKRILELVNKRSAEGTKKYANVVLTKNSIGDASAQLLVSGLSKFIPLENVYTTKHMLKGTVFKKIQKRFGEQCVLVYITSKPGGELWIPSNLKIAIWQVRANDSFEHLYNAQSELLLK